MRDHSKHIQLSREEAVAQTLAMLDELPEGFGWRGALLQAAGASDDTATAHARNVRRKLVERVSLAESIGRVLAYDVVAQNDMPSALTCAMDSIALHWSDFADLPEGQLPDTGAWVRGVDWQFANTGVAMPEGFDTAIVIEHAQVSADEQH
ncbi:MAG: molybdopterin biosynthesis protein, partial [Slackia sp.]|nr:molybdopterin biosynthesis protein [Slackia sp.]